MSGPHYCININWNSSALLFIFWFRDMDDDQEVKELVEKALVNGTDSANHSRAASRVSYQIFESYYEPCAILNILWFF